jgi:molybdopterin molybdotransferase
MQVTVKEAIELILKEKRTFPDERIPMDAALGRVLREPLAADRDFPPFNRVSMDGIAIAYEAFEKGQRRFPIEDIQAAGDHRKRLGTSENCMEVMTGAVCPDGADTVIRYEDISIVDGVAQINLETIQKRQNVHPQGKDRKAGEVIVRAGKRLSPAEIGVADTIGKDKLRVAGQPKVAVISTGDELVEVGEKPLPHQIRKSNVHSLKTALAEQQISSELLHLNDSEAEIRLSLGDALEKYDVLLLSGGVSKGKFDFIPKVLSELGVEKCLYKVAQRPGKPFWFGKRKGTLVFAFPGNPVSSFLCFFVYFLPWWRASVGLPAMPPQYAALAEDFVFRPSLTYYLQVQLSSAPDGRTIALPVKGKGSGDLANLVDANAFLELPPGREQFRAGEVFKVVKYKM